MYDQYLIKNIQNIEFVLVPRIVPRTKNDNSNEQNKQKSTSVRAIRVSAKLEDLGIIED